MNTIGLDVRGRVTQKVKGCYIDTNLHLQPLHLHQLRPNTVRIRHMFLKTNKQKKHDYDGGVGR